MRQRFLRILRMANGRPRRSGPGRAWPGDSAADGGHDRLDRVDHGLRLLDLNPVPAVGHRLEGSVARLRGQRPLLHPTRWCGTCLAILGGRSLETGRRESEAPRTIIGTSPNNGPGASSIGCSPVRHDLARSRCSWIQAGVVLEGTEIVLAPRASPPPALRSRGGGSDGEESVADVGSARIHEHDTGYVLADGRRRRRSAASTAIEWPTRTNGPSIPAPVESRLQVRDEVLQVRTSRLRRASGLAPGAGPVVGAHTSSRRHGVDDACPRRRSASNRRPRTGRSACRPARSARSRSRGSCGRRARRP